MIFENNIKALSAVYKNLSDKLSKIKTNERYEVFMGNKPGDINIFDNQYKVHFYNKPIEDVVSQIDAYGSLFKHEYLYLYGLSNGVLVDSLLKRDKKVMTVVIEPNIELIYIFLHIFDVSKQIEDYSLVLVHQEDLCFDFACNIFLSFSARVFAKTFELYYVSSYYQHFFQKNFDDAKSMLAKALQYSHDLAGNDIADQFLGFSNHIKNIKKMIHTPHFSQLCNKPLSDTAIIVSTGPSLYKQLQLLKKVSLYASIFSVDASVPILEKEGIKADFAFSMERDDVADIFYKKVSKEYKQNTLFIAASLQHKTVMDSLEDANKMIVMRPFEYNKYFQIDNWGYVCTGMSSANMACETAVLMGYKNIIFIGQDLSFAPDGSSHSKGYSEGVDFLKDGYHKIHKVKHDEIKLLGYGGDHYVKSIRAWRLFKDGLEDVISSFDNNFINSTEGGARIEGTKEIPFEKAIKTYIDTSTKKNRLQIVKFDKLKIKTISDNLDQRVKDSIDEISSLISDIHKINKKLNTAYQKITKKPNKLLSEIIKPKNTAQLLEEISHLKKTLNETKIYSHFLHELLIPKIFHIDKELAQIQKTEIKSQADNEKKAKNWILKNRELFIEIEFYITKTLNILKKDYQFG